MNLLTTVSSFKDFRETQISVKLEDHRWRLLAAISSRCYVKVREKKWTITYVRKILEAIQIAFVGGAFAHNCRHALFLNLAPETCSE